VEEADEVSVDDPIGLIVGLIEAIKDFNEAKVEENSTISKFLIENDEVGLE
jgi:hypothetical protein